MNDTHMLIGALSNDLFRVASLSHRGSTKAAERFLHEAKKWAAPLHKKNTPKYITRIAKDIVQRKNDDISIESAETYLMYGILLQNYALHNKKLSSRSQTSPTST